MKGFFKELYSIYGIAALVALAPAVYLWFHFAPKDGNPMSAFAWTLYYLPHTLLCYWPHETGHMCAAGITDDSMLVVCGGTGLEVGLPLVLLAGLLLWRRHLLVFPVMLWLGFVLLDVAYYMADALHPVLIYSKPLDGKIYTAAELGGGHDWVNILKPLGLLSHSPQIASYVYALGIWLLCLAPLAFICNCRKPVQTYCDK